VAGATISIGQLFVQGSCRRFSGQGLGAHAVRGIEMVAIQATWVLKLGVQMISKG
jgi:hypothetical protein